MADKDTTTTSNPDNTPAPSKTTDAETSSSSSTPDLSAKILKQVEYYFSDSNYPKDKFLRAKAQQNPHGYIPVSVLTTFNRLKELSTDTTLIANALKGSTVVELNDDSTMLRRVDPLPEDDTSLPRSIYAKGWAPDTNIEKVADFFAPYGKVLSVRLRRVKATKAFKGTLTVEFSKEEEAKAAIAAAPQPEGQQLIYQTKEAWAQQKREAFQAKKQKKKEGKGGAEDTGEKRKASGEAGEEEENTEESYPRGTILSFKGIGGDQKRYELKPIFAEFGEVGYIDFTDAASEGFVRYNTAEDTTKALKELTDSKRELGGQVPTLSILEGEEEKKYWDVVAASKKAQGGKGGRGGRGRGGRGGRGRGGRGRGNKKQKTG